MRRGTGTDDDDDTSFPWTRLSADSRLSYKFHFGDRVVTLYIASTVNASTWKMSVLLALFRGSNWSACRRFALGPSTVVDIPNRITDCHWFDDAVPERSRYGGCRTCWYRFYS